LTARTHARNASNSRKQSFLAISAAFPRTHAAYVVTYSTNQCQNHNHVNVSHQPFASLSSSSRASHRIASHRIARTCGAHAEDAANNLASGDGAREGIQSTRERE
jgi:hypothetical protein